MTKCCFIANVIAILFLLGCAGVESKEMLSYQADNNLQINCIVSAGESAEVPGSAIDSMRHQIETGLAYRNRLAKDNSDKHLEAQILIEEYRMRPDLARLIVGIFAGCDKIRSKVLIYDSFSKEEVGKSFFESNECAAWGVSADVIRAHCDKIVDYLTGGYTLRSDVQLRAEEKFPEEKEPSGSGRPNMEAEKAAQSKVGLKSDLKSDYETLFWDSVRYSNNIDMYQEYIKAYPNGHFVSIAKIKIKKLSENGPNDVEQTYVRPAPGNSFHLRNIPVKLTEKDIGEFVKKYNFKIPNHNPDGAFENIFVDNRDGTIGDDATGLIWQMGHSNDKLNKLRANQYIESLNKKKFAGCENWRLPTLEELASLMEQEPQSPHWLYMDAIFHDPGISIGDTFWSDDKKEPAPGNRYGGWVINFWYGIIMQADWEDNHDSSMDFEKNKENFVKAVCTK